MRAVAVLALLAGLLLSGCAEPERVAAPSASPSAFNATDVAWIQLAIPMNEQAARMLELAPDRTGNRRIRRLAAEVGDGLRAELTELRALRARAAAPTANAHEGHDMPGMMTAEELRAMGRARDTAFDRLLTAALREHLRQSIVVATGVRDSGHDQAVRAAATAIERARRTQLEAVAAAAVPKP